MSTEPPGTRCGQREADALLGETKRMVEAERARQAEQLELLGPPSPEAMQRAREDLGPKAGELAVVDEARRRGGRRPNSRNRRNEDFRRYLLAMGRHPAITMMEIQNTPPEVLVERSKALDIPKRRMTYQDAQSLRLRAAEGLMPFVESKMPVAAELTAKGDFNLIIPGVNVSLEDAQKAAAGQFILDAEFEDLSERPPL